MTCYTNSDLGAYINFVCLNYVFKLFVFLLIVQSRLSHILASFNYNMEILNLYFDSLYIQLLPSLQVGIYLLLVGAYINFVCLNYIFKLFVFLLIVQSRLASFVISEVPSMAGLKNVGVDYANQYINYIMEILNHY
ncbi:hypothetical protein ACJX0J_021860, partial [Zea mays]